MRWGDRRESSNVEDKRGSGRGLAVGGGLGTVVVLVLALLFGADPRQLLDQMRSGPAPDGQTTRQASPEEEELKRFVSVVLADTEDVWNERFREMGQRYREPTLVLFTSQVNSACGLAESAVGPF
jgi:predicted metalloprotease